MKKILFFALLFFADSALAQTWTAKQSMPDGRLRHCAEAGTDAAGIKRVYVLSGGSESQSYSSVHGYNPIANTWATFASIPTPRVLATSASLGGLIYVIGGLNGGFSNGLNTVEAYEPGTDTWSSVAPLPVTASAAAAAASGGKLYVFGGHQPNSGITLSTTYEYDPVTNAWTQRASMPGPARDIGAVRACNGKIYVIGQNVNYEYNPVTNTWATKTAAPTTQNGRGVVIGSDQRIYLINDRNYNTSTDPIVYYYRFTSDTWHQAPNNIRGYTQLAAAHLDNRLYVTGGAVRFGPYTDNVEQSSPLLTCSCWGSMVICAIRAIAVAHDAALHVSRIERDGGLVAEHANATEVSLTWEHPAAQPGTRITVTGQGLVEGHADHDAGSVTFFQEDELVRVQGDFSALKAGAWRLEAYDHGHLVASVEGPGAEAALHASAWPAAAGLARAESGEASLVVRFDHPVELKAEGFHVPADELRIVAADGRSFEHVNRVQLSADNLRDLIITDIAVAAP